MHSLTILTRSAVAIKAFMYDTDQSWPSIKFWDFPRSVSTLPLLGVSKTGSKCSIDASHTRCSYMLGKCLGKLDQPPTVTLLNFLDADSSWY